MISRRRIFLSMVSSEFRDHRELLAQDLERAQIEVATQERWGVLGSTTLDKIDTFLQQCDAVIHVIGNETGASPTTVSVQQLLSKHQRLAHWLTQQLGLAERALIGISYTQWEAYLALFHGVPLYIYLPEVPSLAESFEDAATPTIPSQSAHLARLKQLDRDRGTFASKERLSSLVLADVNQWLWPRQDERLTPALGERLPVELEAHPSLIDSCLQRLQHAERAERRLRLVLHGMGGVGKSRVALQLGHRLLATGRVVLRIKSIGEDKSLETDILGLHAQLGVERDQVRRWLRQNEDWVLILDGVDELSLCDTIASFIAADCRHGHVIITSRLSVDWATIGYATEEVRPLEQSACAALLQRSLSFRNREVRSDELGALSAVAKELGGLPLALELCASFLGSSRGVTIAGYQRLLESLSPKVLDYRASFSREQISVAKTWIASFDAVSPAARTLMRLLSFLSDDPIPESIFGDPETLEPHPWILAPFQRACETDSFEAEHRESSSREHAVCPMEALRELESFSLVFRPLTAGTSFYVHKLIIRTTQFHLRGEGSRRFWTSAFEFLAGISSVNAPFLVYPTQFIADYVHEGDTGRWNEIYPHAFKLLTNYRALAPSDGVRALAKHLSSPSIAFLAETFRRRGGEYTKQSLELYDLALERVDTTAEMRVELRCGKSAALFEESRAELAVREASAAILDLAGMESDARLARSAIELYVSRGWSLRWLGRLDEAIQDGEVALRLAEDRQLVRECGADIMGLLGLTHEWRGDYTTAIEWLERALSLAIENADYCNEGYSRYFLGSLQLKLGSSAAGEANCRRAIEIGDEYGFEFMVADAGWIEALHFGTLRRWTDARASIERAKACSVDLLEAWIHLIGGLIELGSGAQSASVAWFERSIEMVDARSRDRPITFDFLDTRAFALAGLALASPNHPVAAAEARACYEQARALCSARGVIENGMYAFSIVEDAAGDRTKWERFFG
ncbi:MAG: NB-ARC domain-containing protein [Planctomycetota bacterium]